MSKSLIVEDNPVFMWACNCCTNSKTTTNIDAPKCCNQTMSFSSVLIPRPEIVVFIDNNKMTDIMTDVPLSITYINYDKSTHKALLPGFEKVLDVGVEYYEHPGGDDVQQILDGIQK